MTHDLTTEEIVVLKEGGFDLEAHSGDDPRLTLEALADVDSGRVIDHQAVQAWADSLNTDGPLPVPR